MTEKARYRVEAWPPSHDWLSTENINPGVKITDLETNTVAVCVRYSSRSQNRQGAMKMLQGNSTRANTNKSVDGCS